MIRHYHFRLHLMNTCQYLRMLDSALILASGIETSKRRSAVPVRSWHRSSRRAPWRPSGRCLSPIRSRRPIVIRRPDKNVRRSLEGCRRQSRFPCPRPSDRRPRHARRQFDARRWTLPVGGVNLMALSTRFIINCSSRIRSPEQIALGASCHSSDTPFSSARGRYVSTDLCYQIRQIDRHALQFDLAGVRLGQEQQVVH